MPAFTSSICAPASTWARASTITVEKSPAFISSASFFRPVGLMRSPMITNGRPLPITTSRVAELTTVSVIGSPTSATSPPARTSESSASSVYDTSRRSASRAASASRSSPHVRVSRCHSFR